MKRINLTITAYFYVLSIAFLFCFVPRVFAEENSGTKDKFNILIEQSEHVKRNYKEYISPQYLAVINHAYEELAKAINESGIEPFYKRILDDGAEYEISIFHIIKNGEISAHAKIHYIKWNDGVLLKEDEKSQLYDAQIYFNDMWDKKKTMAINVRDEKTTVSGVVIASSSVFLDLTFGLAKMSNKIYFEEKDSFFIVSGEGIDFDGDGKIELLNIKIKEKTGQTEKKIRFVDSDDDNLWDYIEYTTCFMEQDDCVTEKMN